MFRLIALLSFLSSVVGFLQNGGKLGLLCGNVILDPSFFHELDYEITGCPLSVALFRRL